MSENQKTILGVVIIVGMCVMLLVVAHDCGVARMADLKKERYLDSIKLENLKLQNELMKHKIENENDK